MIKKIRSFTPLILILLVSLFFRAYQLKERFGFAHDGDLYSWIVKDIVINHHFRLIGQLTSAEGIFIGPLYYYFITPFFMLFNMDPYGAAIAVTILGVLTTVSYYFVFSSLFNRKLGLIITFLQAVLLTSVYFDRRVVPSTPSNLWVVWYFYTLVLISRGSFNILPLLGVLIGLIWHFHIALAPALLAVPVAFILAKKLPSLKQGLLFLAALFISNIPFILFEVRHNFSQTLSFIHNFSTSHGGGVGFDKLNHLIVMLSSNIVTLFIHPQNLPLLDYRLYVFMFLPLSLFLVKQKIISTKELLVFYTWIIGVLTFFTVSSVVVSEYYLYSVEIIFLFVMSAFFYWIVKSYKLGKYLILILFTIIFVKNVNHFIFGSLYLKDYQERKAIAEFISSDAQKKGFPCVSVSYVTTPGENVGFRYFFYQLGLHVNEPKSGSPVYTIVIPDEIADPAPVAKFGHIKVIGPENISTKDKIEESCKGENANLTGPMFGYTE